MDDQPSNQTAFERSHRAMMERTRAALRDPAEDDGRSGVPGDAAHHADHPAGMVMDCPPPTGYIDDAGTWHPGPAWDGYAEHVADCPRCRRSLDAAAARGESWAFKHAALVRFIAGPSPTAPAEAQDDGHPEERPLVRLTPQQVGPAAIVVGVASYLLASLARWASLPLVLGWLALLVTAGRRDWLAIDRTPPARLLRR